MCTRILWKRNCDFPLAVATHVAGEVYADTPPLLGSEYFHMYKGVRVVWIDSGSTLLDTILAVGSPFLICPFSILNTELKPAR